MNVNLNMVVFMTFIIMDSIEALFSIENLISGLAGILISLLTFKFGYLGKKEWFGNNCTVWVGIICVIAIMAMLILGLFWYIPCVLIIPVFTVSGRWLWLRKHKKNLLNRKGALDYDIKRYEYYEWLNKKELYRWEVKRFLLPAMNILFEIGAIKRLDEKLEEMTAYKEWYEWKRLKSYVLWNRHAYRELIDLMKPYLEKNLLKENEYARVVINIYGAYRNLEDREGIENYVKKLEDLMFNQKKYSVEIADDLMYYYDETGNTEKIASLTDIIKKLKFNTYPSLLEYYDVLYFQNRRHDNTQGNRELLDIMVEKCDMMVKEEKRKIFEVRLLKLYFENDYGWKDYSIRLFNDADTYLNYSCRVAFEYLRAVNLVVQNCRMQNLYPGVGIQKLFIKILKRIGECVEEFDKEMIELPDDFLYRKKEMLMLKVEYLKANANDKMAYTGFVQALSNTLHKIISLCEKAGDDREKLHFLVVQADEMIAFREDITAFKNKKNLTPEEISAINQVTDEEMNLAMIEAIESVQEINQTLKKVDYDRTQAYYIFYAAYLNMKLDDMVMAKQMLTRYHATGVNIKHYTLAIQKLYEEVKNRLSQTIPSQV